MSKAFIAAVLQDSIGCTGVKAGQAANDLIEAIVVELRDNGGFTLPSFGTFTTKTAKGGQRMNPRTGEKVMIEEYSTVRFKASPVLKKLVAGSEKSKSSASSRAVKVVEATRKPVRQVKKTSVVAPEAVAEKPARGRKKTIVQPVVEEVQVVAPARKKPGPKPGFKRTAKPKAQ